MLQLILFMLMGIAAALIVTGWQGYKDSPWENFAFRKFARSYFFATIAGLIFYYLDTLKILSFDNLGVLLLTILSIERAIGELYKGFIRKKSHPEYVKLFERLHIKFKSTTIRVITGILFAIVLTGAILILLTQLITHILLLPSIMAGLIVGLIGGTLSAAGGAIKDSQFEGFRFKKFIRSPIVGMLGGLILIRFSNNPLLLLLSVTGFERVVVELYKTFILKQVRGIFEYQKPVYVFWLKNRWIFFVLYLIGALILILSTILT